jgi:hypothetical protein
VRHQNLLHGLGLPQILLHRGPLLSSVSVSPATFDVGDEDFTLSRIEDVEAPEGKLVSAFHEAWGNKSFRPAKSELDLARQLIAAHGEKLMQELLPRVVKRLKMKWPDAKTFVAVTRYLPEVLKEEEREKARVSRERQEDLAEQETRELTLKQAQDKAVLQALWDGLTRDEQESIRVSVLAKQPANLQKFPGMVERFCLEEVRRRNGL